MMAACSAQKVCKTPQSQLFGAYGFFALCAGAVWHLVADGEFSAILTMSVMVQCLSLVLLALQMASTGSASGISSRALTLDALAICFRLSSTLWLNGYLPVDASGDHIFQAIDVCSLCVIGWLLYQVLVVRRHTYQAEEDSMKILPMVIGAFLLACMLHGDMNANKLFDMFWMTGLFVGIVAVLPQLWLITRTGGRVEALTSHHIAAMALSRILSGIFMWHARMTSNAGSGSMASTMRAGQSWERTSCTCCCWETSRTTTSRRFLSVASTATSKSLKIVASDSEVTRFHLE